MAATDRSVPLPPLPRGEYCVFLAFAADRTTVLEVAVAKGGAAFALDESGLWRSPALGSRRRAITLRITWAGEPPVIAGVVARPAQEAEASARAREQLGAAERRRCRELLEARAAERFPRWSRETRFFLRFDAWTNPPVLAQLRDPSFTRELSRGARELFALPDAVLRSAPTPERIVALSIGLMKRARERAERLACGERPDRRWRRTLGIPKAERLELGALARFLHTLFWSGWPGARPTATLAEIERAFALFAAGALAFVPVSETDAYRMKLNAEPDSAYFFAFGEFALQIVRIGGPQEADWFSLARLFVALQDVFVARYGAPLQVRDLDLQYLRQQRSAAPAIGLAPLIDHLDRHRKLHPTKKRLEQLDLAHTINVLHAARDEVVQSYQGSADAGGDGADHVPPNERAASLRR